MASEPNRPAHELKDLGYEQVLGDIDATIDAAEQRLFEVTDEHRLRAHCERLILVPGSGVSPVSGGAGTPIG